MAFDLRVNNLNGVSVIDAPGGVIAGPDNFIDLYSWAEKECPDLIPQLHMANGKGSITGLLRLIGQEDTYEADQIQHSEENRLHNIANDVVFSGAGTFTSPAPHNARLNDTILISDGILEVQATVTAITSTTVFQATNDLDAGGVFPAFDNNTVQIIIDFSNSWEKETENFKETRRWEPDVFQNYTHIIKEMYKISGSNMVEKIWIETGMGPRWFNFETERTSTLFDNEVEMTHIFHTRKASGNARGLNGLIPQIERRGNIANEYITDIEELSDIARRAKQQGICREFTVWADHQQMAYFRQMMASVNGHYLEGTNYGQFNNDMEMALMLDFKSVYIDGVTFHFTPWAILEDPSLMGGSKFLSTNIAYLIVPAGNTSAIENGKTVDRPYFSIRYRSDANYSRKREIKIFGPGGTQQSLDAQTTEYLSECTNQVIGANSYFVGRRNVTYNA